MSAFHNTVGTIDPIRSVFIAKQKKKGINIVRLSICADGVEIIDARNPIDILKDPITLGGIVRSFSSTHFIVDEIKYNQLIRQYNIKKVASAVNK